jgi:hypothetical protein
MSDTFERVGTFAAGRANALRDGGTHSQALGFMAILEQVRNLPLASAAPERDLLDRLSRPHAEPEVTKACALMLEQLGPV